MTNVREKGDEQANKALLIRNNTYSLLYEGESVRERWRLFGLVCNSRPWIEIQRRLENVKSELLLAGKSTLGGRRGAALFALFNGGRGKEFPFLLKSFHLSYFVKRHFLAL